MKEKLTFYESLCVPSDSTIDEIKAAYRQCAKTCHPDKNGCSKDPHDKSKQIAEEYRTIIDPEQRHAYNVANNIKSNSQVH